MHVRFRAGAIRGKVNSPPGWGSANRNDLELAALGLAALAVVFYHTAYTFNGGVHTDFQAVSVFFVISGFIMTYITRASGDQFLLQRLIRIAPLYWLCTLLPIAASILKGSGRMWADSSPEHIAESLLFIPYQNLSGDFQPLLAVGWTLNNGNVLLYPVRSRTALEPSLRASARVRSIDRIQACSRRARLHSDGLRVLRP